jgi:transcription elongation factor GreA
VLDEDTRRLHTSTIVNPDDADSAAGKLSAESPVGKALTGRVAGETVCLTTPRGQRKLTIRSVGP